MRHVRGLIATSLRIGNVDDRVPDRRRLHMWMTYADFGALVEAALRREDPGHRAVWAVADGPEPFFDNGAAKALGWHPRTRTDEAAPPEVLAAAPVPPDADMGGIFAAASRRNVSR